MTAITVLLFAVTACRGDDADAYGNFEATEVTVAAEAGGRLLSFDLEEGDRIAKDSVVGVVDTIPLLLERRALVARRSAAAAGTREAEANIAAAAQAVGGDRPAGGPGGARCACGPGTAGRRAGRARERAPGGRRARCPGGIH
jgi:multidrug efflux pump subunit AcrA (membrane-fusion protein)